MTETQSSGVDKNRNAASTPKDAPLSAPRLRAQQEADARQIHAILGNIGIGEIDDLVANFGPGAEPTSKDQPSGLFNAAEVSDALEGLVPSATATSTSQSDPDDLDEKRKRNEKLGRLLDLLKGGTKIGDMSKLEMDGLGVGDESLQLLEQNIDRIKTARFDIKLANELLQLWEANSDRIKSDPGLRDALKVAPKSLTDNEGRTVDIHPAKEIGEGGMGKIFLTHMIAAGSTEIVDVAMKRPHAGEMAEQMQRLYEREIEIAEIISKLDRTKPGAGNVMRAMFISKDKPQTICYELIKDSDGKSRDFDKALEENVPHSRIIDGFAETMKGLQHLHDNGLLHGDLKTGNMMLSGDGNHKIVDTGAVIKEEEIRSGQVHFDKATIKEAEKDAAGNVIQEEETVRWAYKYLLVDGKKVLNEKGEPLRESMPASPYYNDYATLEELVKEGKPLDAAEKRAMGVILRDTLSQLGYFDIADFDGLDMSGADTLVMTKAKVVLKDIDPGLPAHVLQAYNTAKRLINSPKNPYEFIDNDPQKGRDPD